MGLMEHKDIKNFFAVQARHHGRHGRYLPQVLLAGRRVVPYRYQVLAPAANIWMVYCASQPQLINPTDENFFTISCADLLTYGALSFACDYFVDDRTQAFEARFAQLMGDIADQGRDTDWEQSDMAVAPAHNTEY